MYVGMTNRVHIKSFHQNRAVVPLYHPRVTDANGALEPVEMIPSPEVRVTLVLDGTFLGGHPKLEKLIEAMQAAYAAFEAAEQPDEEPPVLSTPCHVVHEMEPTKKFMETWRPQG